MTVGNNSADSVIWVPGESTGRDYTGHPKSPPVDPNTALDAATLAAAVAAAKAYTDALHAKLTASGILP